MAVARTIEDAFKKNVLWLVHMYEFEIEGDPMYLHNGVGNIPWDSKTWKGLGGLITDSGISDDGSLSPVGVTFTLAIWLQEIVDAARTETYIGRPCRKLLVPRNLATGDLLGEPLEVWAGFMGPIASDPTQQTISMQATDERELFHRPIAAVFEQGEFQSRDANAGWLAPRRKRQTAAQKAANEPGSVYEQSQDVFFRDAKRQKSKQSAILRYTP